MKKTIRKENLMRLVWILLLLMTLSAGVYSRFVSTSQSADLSRVAKFVFDTSLKQASTSVKFDTLSGAICKPGDSVEFQLQVTNRKGGDTSEVAEQYEIALAMEGSMPLTCTLLQDGAKKMSWSNTSAVIPGQPAPGGYIGILPAGDAQAHDYVLQVCWPQEENGRQYANGSAAGELTITFTAEQVD